jgi:hypothetical protein
LKVLKEGDQKYQRIEDCYFGDDENGFLIISEINHFVIYDFEKKIHLYCTSAIFFVN